MLMDACNPMLCPIHTFKNDLPVQDFIAVRAPTMLPYYVLLMYGNFDILSRRFFPPAVLWATPRVRCGMHYVPT